MTTRSGSSAPRCRPCSSVQCSVRPPNLTSTAHSGPRDVPGRAETQPLVGALDLPAVDDLLLEDAELVADAVAQRRNLERGHRIEKTGREPPQAAIAEPRLLLLLQQVVEVQPQLRDRLLRLCVNAEIDEVVAKMRADQKFSRQIGDRARALLGIRRGGADPALQQAVAHDVGQREVVVALGRQGRKLALHVEEIVEKRRLSASKKPGNNPSPR